MICIFEVYKRDLRRASLSLVKALQEDCHPDTIERRAKAMLQALDLHDVLNLVVVRDARDGREIYRKAIRPGHPAAAGLS